MSIKIRIIIACLSLMGVMWAIPLCQECIEYGFPLLMSIATVLFGLNLMLNMGGRNEKSN